MLIAFLGKAWVKKCLKPAPTCFRGSWAIARHYDLFNAQSFAIGARRCAVGALECVGECSLVAIACAFGDFADFAASIKEETPTVLQAPCANVALRGVSLYIAERRYHLPLAYMGDIAPRFRAEVG